MLSIQLLSYAQEVQRAALFYWAGSAALGELFFEAGSFLARSLL